MGNQRKAIVCILVATVVCWSMIADAQLYGSEPSGARNLVTINPGTGASTVVGPISVAAGNITEIEWSPDGLTLYATTGGGTATIHTINPATGAVLTSVAHATGAINGLEFDGSGNLLGTHIPAPGNPSTLVIVNTTTGALTTIGFTGVSSIGGLAFDSGFSTLYGIESRGATGIPPDLYTINPGTGAIITTTPTTIPVEASSLEFVGAQLIAGGSDDNLYQINPATGVATVIGVMGTASGKVSGLSVKPDSVSLPATGPKGLLLTIIALVVLGSFVLVLGARRLKSIKQS